MQNQPAATQKELTFSLYQTVVLARDGKIFETMEFEEHLNPFPMGLIRSTLEKLGYREFTVRPFPWFHDKSFEEMDWYCLLARK